MRTHSPALPHSSHLMRLSYSIPIFAATSEECNEPVKNVQNGTKKEAPSGASFLVELILKGSGLLRTAAHDKVNEPLNSHKANVEKCPYGKTDEAYFRCLYRPMAIYCS